jgi:glycosyltransferase involved in cell wall biosynthesis
MTSKRKIAILHYAGPPVIGGVESTISYHARLLAELDYPVTVIAGRGADFHPRLTFVSVPEIDSRHPEVLAAGAELAAGQVGQAFFHLRERLIERLTPVLEKMDICIVHNAITLHKNLPLTAALRSLSERGDTAWIAWCHDFAWQDRLYTPDLHPGYPWDLLRQPWPGLRYVVVSAHRRERLAALLNLPEERIQVVTPGVDVAEFLGLSAQVQRLASQLDLLQAEPLMLYPARVTRRKNIELAIRISAALKERHPRAKLVITGPPGPHNPRNQAYLESLQQLKAELGLQSNVHFLFELGENGEHFEAPYSVVAELFRLADLLLFTSRREGFGIPVLEAGLARLPIFAANIPSIRESAGELANLFAVDDDPQTIANSISVFLEHNRAYQLRQRVLQHFTWRAILKNQLVPMIEEGLKS